MFRHEQRFRALVDYKYCSGCHSCEVACKNELGLPVGKFGIRVLENKPQKVGRRSGERVGLGLRARTHGTVQPLRAPRARRQEAVCVKHCQSFCMSYGTLEEMQQLAGRGRPQGRHLSALEFLACAAAGERPAPHTSEHWKTS